MREGEDMDLVSGRGEGSAGQRHVGTDASSVEGGQLPGYETETHVDLGWARVARASSDR
jgi:hypothetical protein